MPDAPHSPLPPVSVTDLSRRDVVRAGVLFSAAALVGGCASGGKSPLKADRSSVRTFADSERTFVDAGGYSAPPISSAPSPAPIWTPPPPAPTPARPPAAAVQIMPRSSWTRLGIARPREIYAMGGISRITVHHDGMPPTALRGPRDSAARLEQIRSSHVNGRGWADIGYHFIVDPQGRVWEGRPATFQGAHIKDQNENNLGILVLGNFQLQRPTPAALASLDRLLVMQMSRYRVPLARVRTHRELARTECPGNNLQMYMVQTRTRGQLAAMASSVGLA